MGLDDDLIAYYDAEARGGHRTRHGTMRADLRLDFAELLRTERRRRIVDVGAGPGLDTFEWRDDGFDVLGIDLAHANVEVMGSRGLRALTGSLYSLPVRSGAFDAVWTMSTFVHVPNARVDHALTELLRVVRPGSPIGIGTWGGQDFEGVREFGELRPYRFFSLATHERWRETLERHGRLERFDTFADDRPSGWEYQFAVLRGPS